MAGAGRACVRVCVCVCVFPLMMMMMGSRGSGGLLGRGVCVYVFGLICKVWGRMMGWVGGDGKKCFFFFFAGWGDGYGGGMGL
ncbi:hypothetical protein P280DRAFT_290328 [Massarina eburnea CBS 473.64]|uniref:Uncharacterized protein n=1 Tax=Massarina eburnea CBS 473.64 TaxID=1395130 RepID=A0A6A6S4F8_9PLEO|nr:hypothetical protein P280DRAFT_290328 [Massarina eburnea CBS 473.64]